MPRRGESIYKRKDGRWEARYIHHYENGHAKYRYLYGKTYAEVKARRVKEMAHPDSVIVSKTKEVALFCELSCLWLSEVRHSVKESTFTRYHRIVHKHLNPFLADKIIIKIDNTYIRNLYVSLLQGEGERGPLSAKTVGDIFCVLKSIFKYGRQMGYPCADLSQIKSAPALKSPTQILPEVTRKTVEQTILDSEVTASDGRVKLGILFVLYTGLRIGELCGLKHENIDLENRCVTVTATVERIENLDVNATTKTKVIISEPKTESSARMIPIPSLLLDYLKNYSTEADCYLLTGTKKYTEPHQFYLRYKTFMKKLGLKEYTFHALRHTFATRCIDNGFDAKTLSEILGHANVATTLSLYVHPTLEQKRRQMEKLCSTTYS